MRRSRETLESIPSVSSASALDTTELKNLLHQAHALREAEKKLKEIKLKLIELVLSNGLSNGSGLNGVRDGSLGVIITNRRGRHYLDRTALIEAGVTPNQLDAGTKTAKDSAAVELFEIGAVWEPEE